MQYCFIIEVSKLIKSFKLSEKNESNVFEKNYSAHFLVWYDIGI